MSRKITMAQVRRAQKAAARAELTAKIEKIRTEEAKADSDVKRAKLRAKRMEYEHQKYRLRQRRNGNGR